MAKGCIYYYKLDKGEQKVLEFYTDDVFFTDFYGVVQQELGLKERLLAKHVMFKLLFKKTNRPDELLSKLSQRYQVLMSIIADYTRRNCNSELSNTPNRSTMKN